MQQSEDYPALYRSADAASNEAQASLIFCHKLNIFLLAAAALMALISTLAIIVAIISALLFLGSLATYIYMHNKNFQKTWYEARALAESIKTATWRLALSAEPFNAPSDETNISNFRKLLIELLYENRGMGAYLSGEHAQQEQITPMMLSIIQLPFPEKKQCYLDSRIVEQLKWYSKKSGENRASSKKYFIYLCAAYFAAISLLLVRIAYPSTPFLPIDLFAVIASSIVGWVQIKRFDELASAYGLTAHEIGIIKSRFESVQSSTHLSNFVGDAENAFSREHTQWAARRDH